MATQAAIENDRILGVFRDLYGFRLEQVTACALTDFVGGDEPGGPANESRVSLHFWDESTGRAQVVTVGIRRHGDTLDAVSFDRSDKAPDPWGEGQATRA